MMTKDDLAQWAGELVLQKRELVKELDERVEKDAPDSMAHQLARVELAGRIQSIDKQISMLGQIVRGARL